MQKAWEIMKLKSFCQEVVSLLVAIGYTHPFILHVQDSFYVGLQLESEELYREVENLKIEWPPSSPHLIPTNTILNRTKDYKQANF